jgi:hypothetical protein
MEHVPSETDSSASESPTGPPRVVLLAPALSLLVLLLSLVGVYVPGVFFILLLSLIVCPVVGLVVILLVFVLRFNGDITLRHRAVVIGVLLACLDVLIPAAVFAFVYWLSHIDFRITP